MTQLPSAAVPPYSSEFQTGKTKTSGIVTVVVQCDGSQVDSCWEYEHQFTIVCHINIIPNIIVTAIVLL